MTRPLFTGDARFGMGWTGKRIGHLPQQILSMPWLLRLLGNRWCAASGVEADSSEVVRCGATTRSRGGRSSALNHVGQIGTTHGGWARGPEMPGRGLGRVLTRPRSLSPSSSTSTTRSTPYIIAFIYTLHTMRASMAASRQSQAPGAIASAAATAKLLEKKKEYEAVAALERASAQFLKRIEDIGEDFDVIADAGIGERGGRHGG